MKRFQVALFLLSVCIISSQCKKSSTAPAATVLEITVTDNTAAPVSGATVSIFSDSADFVHNTNAVMTAVSDGKGVVEFTGLSSVRYYFFAEKGCNNNFNSGCVLKDPLSLNGRTSVDAAIYGTGSLQFSNLSRDPYTVYVNNANIGVLNGEMTFTGTNVPLGSYSIHVVQNSGFATTPIDETFTVNVSCGNLATATFP